jgi:hypothetical protein
MTTSSIKSRVNEIVRTSAEDPDMRMNTHYKTPFSGDDSRGIAPGDFELMQRSDEPKVTGANAKTTFTIEGAAAVVNKRFPALFATVSVMYWREAGEHTRVLQRAHDKCHKRLQQSERKRLKAYRKRLETLKVVTDALDTEARRLQMITSTMDKKFYQKCCFGPTPEVDDVGNVVGPGDPDTGYKSGAAAIRDVQGTAFISRRERVIEQGTPYFYQWNEVLCAKQAAKLELALEDHQVEHGFDSYLSEETALAVMDEVIQEFYVTQVVRLDPDRKRNARRLVMPDRQRKQRRRMSGGTTMVAAAAQ